MPFLADCAVVSGSETSTRGHRCCGLLPSLFSDTRGSRQLVYMYWPCLPRYLGNKCAWMRGSVLVQEGERPQARWEVGGGR